MNSKTLILIGFAFVGCSAIIFFLIFGAMVGTAVFALNFPDKSTPGSSWTGSADIVQSITVPGGEVKMPEYSGKIGHEEHFRPECEGGTHITDKYSPPLSWISDGSCGSFGAGMTPSQERWYFNMRWDYGTASKSDYRHKKVIVTNPVNNKRIVVSIEEYGPAGYVITRDGVNAGAPPDVYNYLELADPYTGNPNDKQGYATWGLAKDQNIPLGPLN